MKTFHFSKTELVRTILFRVAGNRCGFDSVASGRESEDLHAVIGELAESVEDCLTRSDDLGILARFICDFSKWSVNILCHKRGEVKRS